MVEVRWPLWGYSWTTCLPVGSTWLPTPGATKPLLLLSLERATRAARSAPAAVYVTGGWAEFSSVVIWFHIYSINHPLFATLRTSYCGITLFSTQAKTYASVSCVLFHLSKLPCPTVYHSYVVLYLVMYSHNAYKRQLHNCVMLNIVFLFSHFCIKVFIRVPINVGRICT